MAFNFAAVKDMLCCPNCRGGLVLQTDALLCANGDCRRQYEIRDDIPILLIDESQELSPEDWERAYDEQ